LALEVDSTVVADSTQYGQIFAQARNFFAARYSECSLFQRIAAKPDAQAEVAPRGGLGGLRDGGDQQRMPRIDRNDGGAHTQPRYRVRDHRGQCQRVDVEPLTEPHLPHAPLEGARSL